MSRMRLLHFQNIDENPLKKTILYYGFINQPIEDKKKRLTQKLKMHF